MRTSQPWIIPFNNTYYLCWKDENGKPRHRQMTDEEERKYFSADDQERVLNEMLNQ